MKEINDYVDLKKEKIKRQGYSIIKQDWIKGNRRLQGLLKENYNIKDIKARAGLQDENLIVSRIIWNSLQ